MNRTTPNEAFKDISSLLVELEHTNFMLELELRKENNPDSNIEPTPCPILERKTHKYSKVIVANGLIFNSTYIVDHIFQGHNFTSLFLRNGKIVQVVTGKIVSIQPYRGK